MDYLIEFLYAKFLQSSTVCTDTRKLKEGDLYFALKGPNFDGNQYAAKALELGALYAVVDDPDYFIDGKSVLVDDSLAALQNLASFHRGHLRCPVIGITGSNGKTTTKELVRNVLEKEFITACTEGNLNNHIGVPLTVLSINPQAEVAIVEMGASAVGEIEMLCEIAKPTIGLITNIGKAHTETFGGIDGVLRGKTELFNYLRNHNGQVFINQLDPRLFQMVKRFDSPMLFPEGDLSYLSADPYIRYQVEDEIVETKLIGAYNFSNIAAAISVGRILKVSEDKIHEAIKSYVPDNNRSEVIELGTNLIIKDAYNANPDSMMASLKNFAEMAGNKVVILGDMNELENSPEEHAAIGNYVLGLGFDSVFFCGIQMESAYGECAGSNYFVSTNELIAHLSDASFDNVKILLKASRGMQFEKVYDIIESKYA